MLAAGCLISIFSDQLCGGTSMSNISPKQAEARVQVCAQVCAPIDAPSLFNRSLWLTLLLATGLIAALFFVFSLRASAAPIDTRISQRIQNSLTSGSAVTATYGEALTVTMRFTVTAGTYLTGPITVSTRFAGWTTPNNQYGYRFLGYQGPLTAAVGTPDLTGVNFVSNTVGSTTYLTWTFNAIDNSAGASPAVYEIPYQVRLVWDGTTDTGGSTAIPNSGSTTIAWTGSGSQSATALAVTPVKPNLTPPANASKTYRLVAGPAGETLVVYTVVLTNGTSTSPAMNPSPAYNLAVTDSLDSRLVYSTAWPLPNNPSVTPGANTLLVWNTSDWTLAPNAVWTANITATVPPTAVNAIAYTNTVQSYYATQPALPPDAAAYTPSVSASFTGGVTGSKQANPATGVRIGDAVTYTVRYTLTPAIYLNSPVFTDTLPLGFHYRANTFVIAGDAALNGSAITVTSGVSELLRWQINNIPAAAANRFITVTYTTDVNGFNAAGTAVYTTNLQNLQSVLNAVQINWLDDADVARRFTLNSTTQVAQPYLVNADFNVGIVGWSPFTAPYEIGSTASYTLSVRNSGAGPAYEVVLSNTLPPGVSYLGNIQVQPITLSLLLQPTPGATGVISFVIGQLPPGSAKSIVTFDTLVGNTARPGDPLASRLSLIDYSSQPGGMYDNNGNDNDFTGVIDRHYSTIGALPAPAAYTFTLKGLTAIKTDAPDPVQPGQVLTYSISYSNTSAVITATNATLVDTYDQHLIYLGAASVPGVPLPVHNLNARTLTWNVGTLNPGSANARITATFQVEAPIDPAVRVLTNTIASDWDSPAPLVSRFITTTLWQPIPTISLDDRGVNAQANQLMTYTLIYSNAAAATGATTGTFTITLNYASYVTFITSTGRLPVVPDGTVFTDTLGPGISRTVNLRMQVARPLPYTLTSFTSTATIVQPDVNVSSSDSEETPVWLPRYQLVKNNSSPLGNPPVRPGDSIGYQIIVTNTGEVTGTNIVISDVWDANTFNQSLGSNWQMQGTYAVYTTIAKLPPLSTVTLDPLLMYVTTSLTSSVQLIHNTAYLTSLETTQQASGIETPIVGLFINKNHTPDPVYPGNVLTYTIAYTMYGIPSTSPVITDYLPAEVTYMSCAVDNTAPPYNGVCNQNNHVVVWSWNTLGQDMTGIVTVTVQAPATEWITLTNNYASDSASGAPYRNGPPDLTYVGIPKMSIGKQASTALTPPAPGDWIRYNLIYTNAGSYKATGTMVTDTVPANTIYTDCSPQPCGQSGGVVTWNVGEVPITTTRVLTMLVQINPNAGNTTIVNSNYGLSADRGIFNLNGPVAASTSVVKPALSVSKSASPSWIVPTGLITYTVRYTNTGGGLFTSLNFIDSLYVNGSANTPFQSASPNCSEASNTVICTANNLAPNASQEFTITVKGNGVSSNEVITNAVTYWASNQTETLPEATTTPIEVLVSNAGAAADFSGTPTTGPVPLNVTFTNLTSVNGGVSITDCQWNFGDGTPVNTTACLPTSTVQHTYNGPGTYPVALTINTDPGNNTTIRTRPGYIIVSGAGSYGVQIASSQPAKSGARGTQVIYTVIVTNTGSIPDTFNLSKSAVQWPTDLPASVGPLAVQAAATLHVTVSIPSLAPLVASDTVTVTATSVGASNVSSSVMLKTSTLIYPVFLPLIKK
jgi:fimbrial isopeptide formation D2 family protein/uncharacterized repeat protein (TIGR01451 family)